MKTTLERVQELEHEIEVHQQRAKQRMEELLSEYVKTTQEKEESRKQKDQAIQTRLDEIDQRLREIYQEGRDEQEQAR